MTSKGCPFQPKRGYTDARADYLFHFYKVVIDDDDDHGDDQYHDKSTSTNINQDKEDNLPTPSRIASMSTDDPLYFWQLYSLIGRDPLILEIVTSFYRRVFADTDNPWFASQCL